ncbi:MAG: TonB-dependent receptor [Rubricoccaceae bacterium]
MRRSAFLLVLLAATAHAQAPTAHAQAPPAPPPAGAADTLGTTGTAVPLRGVLEPVTVTATRLPLRTHRAPVRVAVLSRADAEAAGARTAADLVEARSGVFVRRYGPDGLATLALRAGAASHTLVTLDGHAVSDPQLGQTDVSLLPAVLIETAEVLHGAASALYGTDAVGGVLALRTPEGPAARAQLRTGAWGERGASALAAAPLPRTGLTATLALDAAASEGDYRIFDPTRLDPATGRDGLWTAREGADRRSGALFARLAGQTGGLRLASGLLLTEAARGLYAPEGPGQRQDDAARRAWLDASGYALGLRLAAGLAYQQTRLRYRHPAIGVDSEGRTRTTTLHGRADRTWTLSPGGAPPLGTLAASFGARLAQAEAEHPNLTADARETSAALFGSAVLEAGRVLVAPALRLDHAHLPGEAVLQALSPSLGLNLQPTAWPGLRLKAAAGRAFRAPTFNDRFWQPGGNPALRPERGYTLEAGVSLRATPAPGAALAAEATLFRSALRDAIAWRPGRFPDGFYWAPQNIGRTRTVGAELSADGALRRGALSAEASLNLTHAAARDVSDPAASSFGQPLLYVPDGQARAHVALGWGALRAGGGVRAAGSRTTATDGAQTLPGYALWDARAEIRLPLGGAQARLALHLENLTDVRYEVVPRHPMPPRHGRLVLALEAR